MIARTGAATHDSSREKHPAVLVQGKLPLAMPTCADSEGQKGRLTRKQEKAHINEPVPLKTIERQKD